MADTEARGLNARTNHRVIDLLQPGDVPVIDLMNATPGNNFGGDNLHAAIYGATGTGVVVEGTIRDIEGIHELPTFIPPHLVRTVLDEASPRLAHVRQCAPRA